MLIRYVILSSGLYSPLTAVFVADKTGYYDIIIVDSTDPGGPGEPLFGAEFYRKLKAALRPGGVIASQAESTYLYPDVVKHLNRLTGELFTYSGYASIMIPTYPTGSIGLCVASDGGDVSVPGGKPDAQLQARLRYYNPEVLCFLLLSKKCLLERSITTLQANSAILTILPDWKILSGSNRIFCCGIGWRNPARSALFPVHLLRH